MEDYPMYPTFEFSGKSRQISPRISLPINYRGLAMRLYKEGGFSRINSYAEIVGKKMLSGNSIKLKWKELGGLVKISTDDGKCLELHDGSNPCFKGKNLDRKTSFALGAVAMKYLSELMNTRL